MVGTLPLRAGLRLVARSLGWLAPALLAACPSPSVSPWGQSGGPSLRLYLEKTDLQANLQQIAAEVQSLALEQTGRFEVKDAGGERYTVLSFEGRNSLGHKTTAVRVASEHGVVVALGPLRELDPPQPTELVRSLAEEGGGTFAFPRDITSDGLPDLLLRDGRGQELLLGLQPHGTRATSIEPGGTLWSIERRESDFLLLRAVGCIRGRQGPDSEAMELQATLKPCPSLTERQRPLLVPLFYSGQRFERNRTAAREWHQLRADRLQARRSPKLSAIADLMELEAAFHALSAGADSETVLTELRATPSAQSKEDWLRAIVSLEQLCDQVLTN